MKFSQSVAKIGQSLTYRRAWRRARRLFQPVATGPMLAQIDPHGLRELQEKYGALPSDAPPLWRHYSKYLEIEKHVRQNIRRAQDVNLHRLPPQDILDIGCGGGFFVFVAQNLGHRALGMDVEGIPVFDSLVKLLGIERIVYRVKSFGPLPDLGRKFDLITSFATAFHGGKEDSWRWGTREWDFFLSDLKRNLKPGGGIFLDLNAAYGGEYYTPEISSVLRGHGAVIERGNISIPDI